MRPWLGKDLSRIQRTLNVEESIDISALIEIKTSLRGLEGLFVTHVIDMELIFRVYKT